LVGAVVVGIVTHGGAKAKHVGLFYAANGELGLIISDAFDRGVSDFGFVAKKVDDYPDTDLRLNSLSADQQLVMVFSVPADVTSAARQHADTRYVLLDRRVDAPNVTSLEFAHNEGSFLVGAAAALKTKTGTIGFVGGVDMDVIWQFQAGFEAGARAVDPGIRILTHYLAVPPNLGAGFLSPAAGELAARKLYTSGADVIFAAAGTSGLGVFQAAVDLSTTDHQLWAIGVDSDQYLTVAQLPGSVGASAWQEHILTSMIKRYDTAVYSLLDSYAHGHLETTPQLLGLAENGVDISYSGGYINDIRPKIESFRQDIIAGKIKVPCRPLDRLSESSACSP
jgi:basic membrane protein A